MESQQISELLKDLRRVVAVHGEFLANFRQHTLTEEPPDSLDERSPPHPPWHTRPPDSLDVCSPQLSTSHTRPPDESRQRRTLPCDSSNSPVQPLQPTVASSNRTWRPQPSRTTGGTGRDQRQPIHATANPIANQEPDSQPLQRIEEVKQTIMVVKEHNVDDDPIDQTCSDLHMASEISVGDDIKGVGYDAEQAAQVQALTEPILPREGSTDRVDEEIVNKGISPDLGAQSGVSDDFHAFEDARVLPMCNELPSDVTPVANLEGPESSSEVCVANGLDASMVSKESAVTAKELSLLSMLVDVDLIYYDDVASHILEKFECVHALLLPVAAPPAASSLTASSFTEVQLESRATVYGSNATALALNNHDFFTESLAMALPNSTTASRHNRSLVTFFGDRKQRCADLRLGAVEGVHIFDPGVFKRVETIQVTYSVVESEVNDKIIGVVASICSVGINALIFLVEYLGSLGILCLFIDKFIEKVENVVTRGGDIDLDVVLSPFGISFGDKSHNGEFVVIVYRDINYGGGLVPYVRMDLGYAPMMADVLTDFSVSMDSMTNEAMQGLPGFPMTTNHNRSHVEYNIGDTVPLWLCLPPLSVSAPDQLPHGFDPSPSIVVPVKANAEQIVSCDGVLQHQWLVHWSLQCSPPPWELRDALLHHFPTLSLEDKAIVMEGGVDRDSNLEDRPTKYKDLTPH